ncbi:MAG: NAD-dependent epimerase/dehydratase family protein [Flavobacteriaceae bacterium]|nr:NAD-dependent epimerase/dehydratase family protein [Flavobacteriaceae bacterium]
MILVTGGTGLVGSHLLYQLALQNESIVAIHRNSSDLNAVKNVFTYYSNDPKLFATIKWIEADIIDISSLTKAFEDITHVYHCAAMISFNASDYKNMRKVNIEGTANIVNLCIENNIKKLCFVSSIAAVGKPLTDNEITEDNEWNVEQNNYGYAITKYGAEIEVWRASQEGVAIVIVNPGLILGPGFWQGGSGKLFTNMYNGFKFYTEGITGFVGVVDIASIMISLMKSNIKNERYILVSENDSFKNVFYAIADGLSKKRPSIKATKILSAIAWRVSWLIQKITGSKSLITKQTAESSNNKYRYSNKKIIEGIGYKFEPLSDTIISTCKFYLKDL